MTRIQSDYDFMSLVRKRLLLSGLLEGDYPIQRLDAIISTLSKYTATSPVESASKLTSVTITNVKPSKPSEPSYKGADK